MKTYNYSITYYCGARGSNVTDHYEGLTIDKLKSQINFDFQTYKGNIINQAVTANVQTN